jgi:hypothetical protein
MDESKKVTVFFIVMFVAIVVPATLYAGYDVSIHRNDKTYDANRIYGYNGFREVLLYFGLIVLLLCVTIILILDPSTRELLHV